MQFKDSLESRLVLRPKLRLLLSKRFGALDDAALERFKALSMDGPAVIYDAIFTASDIDHLLTRPSRSTRPGSSWPIRRRRQRPIS